MHHHKKFCFTEEPSQSPKPKYKSRKVKYDFNQLQEEDAQQNHAPILKNDTMKTVDTLGIKTTFSPIQNQLNTSLPPAQLINLGKRPLEDVNTGPTEKLQLVETQKVSQYLNDEEVSYIQKLFFRLLNGQQKIQLSNLIVQQKFSGNDRLAKEQALMFLLLNSLLKEDFEFTINNTYTNIHKSKFPFNQTKLDNLKNWAIYALRKHSQFQRLVEEKKVTKRWMMLAENKISQLVEEFLTENHFDEAILVSNIQDKAFLTSFEFHTSKQMKNEFTFLQSKNIKITPISAWIVDFAIAIQYFNSSILPESMKELCEKYQNSTSILLSSLVAITLHFSQQKFSEKYIEKIVTQQKKLKYLDQVLYLWTLNKHQKKQTKLYQKVADNIITKIHNPALFVELMIFSKFNEAKIKSSISKFFERNQYFSEDHDRNVQILYETILQKTQNIETQDTLQVRVLYEWMQCEKYLKMFQEKKYIEAIKFFCRNLQTIQHASTHDQKFLFSTLIKNIVKFELACSYKESKQRQYYNILQELRPNLRNNDDVVIVQGCLAFIQLKLKVFWLHDEKKFDHYYALFNYLKKSSNQKSTSENSKSFLISFRKTLFASITSIDGKIYLSELAEQESQPKEIAKAIKAQLKQQAIISNQNFKKSKFFKLLEMLNWNKEIGNLIVIKLLF